MKGIARDEHLPFSDPLRPPLRPAGHTDEDRHVVHGHGAVCHSDDITSYSHDRLNEQSILTVLDQDCGASVDRGLCGYD
jgi:hypothetical protein